MAEQAADTRQDGLLTGRVFARGNAVLTGRPLPALLLAFLFGGLPATLLSYGTDVSWTPIQERYGDGEVVALFVVLILSGAVLNVMASGALMRLMDRRDATLSEAVGAAFRAFPRLLALAVLIAAASTVGLALLVVPGALLYVAWAVAGPVSLAEQRGVLASLRRSQALTEGRRAQVFIVLLLLTAVVSTVSVTMEMLSIWWWQGLDALTSEQTVPITAFNYWIATAAIHTLLSAWWGATHGALYLELRDRTDGPSSDRLAAIFA